MNGFILILPIIFIRYGILSFLSKEAVKRAAFFPPTEGKEKGAYWIYQITTLSLLIISFFVKVKLNNTLSFIGLGIYITSMILYTISIIQFAKPNQSKINIAGLYKISRNPMYIAFFLYFMSISMLTGSWLFLFILIIFQVSVHYLILSEERWCIKEFGEEYIKYMNKVGRYI